MWIKLILQEINHTQYSNNLKKTYQEVMLVVIVLPLFIIVTDKFDVLIIFPPHIIVILWLNQYKIDMHKNTARFSLTCLLFTFSLCSWCFDSLFTFAIQDKVSLLSPTGKKHAQKIFYFKLIKMFDFILCIIDSSNYEWLDQFLGQFQMPHLDDQLQLTFETWHLTVKNHLASAQPLVLLL